MRTGWLYVIAAFVIATGIVWSSGGLTPPDPTTAPLALSGGRTVLGLELTNREPSRVTACDVTATDADGAPWIATMAELAPLASTRVLWKDFAAAGQPMPAAVAVAQRTFTVSCLVDETRREVTLSF